MRAALAIAKKDLTLLARDPAAVFWALVFPTAFALLFGAVLGRNAPPHLVVAVTDHADNEASRALLSVLSKSGGVATTMSEEGARDAVKRGEAAAAIALPADYPEGDVGLVLDPSRAMEGEIVRAVLTRARTGDAARIRESFATSGGASGHESALPAAILWGLIGCAGTFAISIAAERSSGTLLRLRAAPISFAAVLCGKALACFVACVFDAALLVALGRVVLGARIGAPIALFFAVLSAAVCFTGVTLLVGSLGKTEQATGGAGWSALLLLAMFGGAMVPATAMPDWMRAMSELSPVRWGIVALEGATWRGLPTHDVLVPALRLAALGLVAAAIAALFALREEA